MLLGAPEPNELESAGSGVTSAEATSSLGVAFTGGCSAASSPLAGVTPVRLESVAADGTVAAGTLVLVGSEVGWPESADEISAAVGVFLEVVVVPGVPTLPLPSGDGVRVLAGSVGAVVPSVPVATGGRGS
ncbi:hypothetical protein GCM10008019_41780 [Deinococcus soli (ex Cha et al. 2016)]|nr:hypothetical protein GCM10008019_41780 [Deinococcus soli (ex Cha et al. 2016)]